MFDQSPVSRFHGLLDEAPFSSDETDPGQIIPNRRVARISPIVGCVKGMGEPAFTEHSVVTVSGAAIDDEVARAEIGGDDAYVNII